MKERQKEMLFKNKYHAAAGRVHTREQLRKVEFPSMGDTEFMLSLGSRHVQIQHRCAILCSTCAIATAAALFGACRSARASALCCSVVHCGRKRRARSKLRSNVQRATLEAEVILRPIQVRSLHH